MAIYVETYLIIWLIFRMQYVFRYDFDVIVYKTITYVQACLKDGNQPSLTSSFVTKTNEVSDWNNFKIAIH